MSFLEHIFEGDWAGVRRNFERLMTGVLGTGGQSLELRVGADSVTFTAAANSAAKTVSHGLGKVPVSVQATGSGFNGVFFDCDSFTDTSFDVVGWRPAGSITGSRPFTWTAVG